MSSFGILILFCLSCKLLPCHGNISPPSNETEFVFSNGSTAKLEWTFVDATDIVSRIWSFKSTDGSAEEGIAKILGNGPPQILNSSLPRVSVKKPATLILHNVTEKYDGTYKFTLAAIAGSDISEVVVFIAVKPNVTINCSSHVFINKSKEIICQCECENGNPPAECTWYKNDVQIGEIKTRVNTLIRRDVNKEDSGNYTCVGKSHDEAQDEKTIKVTVYSIPNVKINCTSYTVNEGAGFSCRCICGGGDPPAKCTWYKDRKRISETRMEANTLIRHNVNKTDSGIYVCFGESLPVIALDEMSINVTVYYATIGFSSIPAVINETVKITCASNGPPLLSYTIYHNNTKVESNRTYTISSVNWTHPGTYKCIANNKLGELSVSRFLYVNETKPPPPTTPSETTRTVPSSSTSSGGDPGGVSDNQTGLIVGSTVGGLAFIVTVCFLVYYCKCKERENKRGHADVNPDGSRVMTNHYELEEDHGEDAGAYDTVKQSDDGEGSQDKKKPAGDSLPPVYASVNKDNRQGNTLYASLDSEALRKPGSKKKQPETKNAPTEYASIDFMQTGKTPNADNA